MLAKEKSLLLLVLVIAIQYAFAQNVGIGTTNPHSSARLEIKSNNQGLLIPRLTTNQRNAISKPAHSLLIFNVDNFCIEVYDSVSGSWLAVSCPISCPVCDTVQCITPQVDSISGPTILCPGDTVQYVLHGSGGNAFIWNIPANWVMLSQGQIATFIADSSGTIYGHLCNQCGCSTDSIIVSAGSAPAYVSLTGTDSVCLTDTVIVYASGGVFYNWYVPISWTVVYQGDSLVALPSDTGAYYIKAEACNSCGCSPMDSFKVAVLDTALGPVSIVGPTFVCAGDTLVYKAPNPNGVTWNWQYPTTWQLIAQGGDSIVLVPDTVDGNVIVEICNEGACICKQDILFIQADSCLAFCLTIGGTGDEWGASMAMTSDNNIVILGGTTSFSQGSDDHYVVKIDKQGNLIWATSIGTTAGEIYLEIDREVFEYNGVIYGGGTTYLTGSRRPLYWGIDLVSGSVLWSMRLDICCYLPSVLAYHNGNSIIFGGHTTNGGVGNIIFATDFSGNFLWGKSYGSDNSAFDDMTYVPSQKKYVAGTYNPAGLAVLDSLFNIVWARKLLSSGWTHGITVKNDKIYACGRDGNNNLFIHSSNINGSFNWTRLISFGVAAYAGNIEILPDGNLVFVGYISSGPLGGEDGVVILSDTLGNILNIYALGGSGNERLYDVVIEPSSPGSVYVTGSTTSFGNGSRDLWIAKFDVYNPQFNCTTGCGVSPITNFNVTPSTTWTSYSLSVSTFSGSTPVGASSNGGTQQNCP